MSYNIGNHHKNRYDKALEEYVEAHAACEDPLLRVSRRILHNIRLALFHSKSQRREAVCDQVDPQKMHRF